MSPFVVTHCLLNEDFFEAVIPTSAAISTFAAWLIGIITSFTGQAPYFKVHSAKFICC